MLKSETRDIDGMKITCTQHDVMRQLALFAKLGKLFAPALSKLQGVSLESDVNTLAPILGELFVQLDAEDAGVLASELLAGTYVIVESDSGAMKIDLLDKRGINRAFNGKLKTMLAALKFAFEVNFGDFFGGELPAKAKAAQAPAVPALSKSSSPSILP